MGAWKLTPVLNLLVSGFCAVHPALLEAAALGSRPPELPELLMVWPQHGAACALSASFPPCNIMWPMAGRRANSMYTYHLLMKAASTPMTPRFAGSIKQTLRFSTVPEAGPAAWNHGHLSAPRIGGSITAFQSC